MIIGNGDIASALKDLDRDDFIFFASGVSDSQSRELHDYAREKLLLMKYRNECKRLVYFSSLSIFDNPSLVNSKYLYVEHKKWMEYYIRKKFSSYCIIRIGNIAWGNNPKTVVNYFRNAIKNSEPVVLRDEYKYICTLEDFRYWIGKIPDFNCELNITGERIHAKELYERLRNG